MVGEHDVVVVGAGPGGCSAGFFMKRLRPDMSVLIVERLDERRYDKYHRMCGEAISSLAFRELNPIKPTRVLNRIRFAEEIWPGGLRITSRANGYIIDRSAFLRDIVNEFKEMGGQLAIDSLKGVTSFGDGFELDFASGERVRCGSLIAADGAFSKVRRELFSEEPPEVVSARQYLLENEMPGDVIRFHYGSRYGGGYRWEFPYGSMTKVGFPAGTDVMDRESQEHHSRCIPVGGLRRVVLGNACLVGDAAAQANPLTFGGIRIAMVAGRKAAESVAVGELGRYQKWWNASRFSSPIFMEAYNTLMGMSEDKMRESMLPFRRGYGPLSYARAYLGHPEFRDLYRAYRWTSKYGW